MKPKEEPISIDQMKVWVFNVVLVLFPKMMRLLLQSFITPRGLLNKYNNRDLKVDLTDTEKSEMEKLPKMTEFTIELCYKILRFEHLVPEPSSQWEVLPDENHQEITDDIKRMVFDTNDVCNKLGEDVSNSSYETFKGKVEGIVARIDSYLGLESCKQCYEEVISLDTQLDICLRELRKLREIDVTGTTTPSLSDMEIQNGKRFARIGWVIIDLFPKILRAVIQMKIAADFLYTHCSIKTHWDNFSYEEQNKLKSLNSSKTYDLLDIPLAYRLLRQFNIIKEPTNKWGKPPSSSDISTGDDIERIRILRNNFAHRSNINITQSEFDVTFSTFKDICRRMDVYFNNDRASGYENDVSRKETTPMDNQLRQKYQRSLQELENIKLRFIEPPVKFYWGENVESSLKNLRQVYKDEKGKRKDVTDAKLRLQIVVENIEDESAISRLVHQEFKDEINTEFTSIQLINVSEGSIILHVDILREAVCSVESFQLTLVQFVYKVLQTGRLRLPTMGSLDVVLVQEDEYTKMQLLMQESAPQLCFDFEIERSEFETDVKLKAKLGETVTTMLKHSNGKGQLSDVSATISSCSFGEIALDHPVFVKTETVEEISETGIDVKKIKHDSISLTPTLKMDPDRLNKSDWQTNVADRKYSTSFQRVKMETTDVEKYDEIFVDVDNLKCLLKIKGLPNDLVCTELEERPPDVKDNQLLYVEWTLSCPSKWNVALVSSSIKDNLSSFHDEFSIDFVYNETSSRLVIHTTTQRCVFRSYSSLEGAVKNLLGNILNVSNIKSTEPEDLSASVLIMTKPEEEEFLQPEFNKEVKTDQSILGLKDNVVTCEHCKNSFSCNKCTSKINHIRRLNQALKMKDQTIQRLERALTKREEEIIEEDKSDNESDYFVETITLHEDPKEENIKTSKTAEKAMLEEPEQKKRKTEITSDIAKSEDVSKSLNKNDSNILVDVKQALQKLAEIPLLDYYLKMYRTYLKDLDRKDEFTTTDEAYGTDIQFLNVGYPTTKCNYCQTEDESQISCSCYVCKIFFCDNCVVEHRKKNRNHSYLYQVEMLREYKQLGILKQYFSIIIDMKFMAPGIVAILEADELSTYNMSGEVINSLAIRMSMDSNRQIACLNSTIAVTTPSDNLIEIVTLMVPTTITNLETPAGTIMTGGITCRMDILYVAFTDAIRLMDLSGQIQKVINIPSVKILHSVNNDKLLCVYDSDKTMSCLDLANDSLHDFERFPFHPEYVTTDDVGNIIFIEDGVIWQGDSDGKNFKIIRTPKSYDYRSYKHLSYNKHSKMLFTVNGFVNVEVYKN